MPESQNPYLTTDAAEAVARAVATHVGADELVDPAVAITAVHVPGTPLARVEDEAASRAFEAEQVEAPRVVAVEYDGIDTRTPEANYATRSNIVRP